MPKRSSFGPFENRTYLSGIGMFGYGMPGPKLNGPSENRIRPDFGSPLYTVIGS